MTPEERAKAVQLPFGVKQFVAQDERARAEIAGAITAAVDAEREGCAKVVESALSYPPRTEVTYQEIAAAIRARGD